jgi:hypothetical protein
MEAENNTSAQLTALSARLEALSERLNDPTDRALVAEASNVIGGKLWPLTCPHCRRPILPD